MHAVPRLPRFSCRGVCRRLPGQRDDRSGWGDRCSDGDDEDSGAPGGAGVAGRLAALFYSVDPLSFIPVIRGYCVGWWLWWWWWWWWWWLSWSWWSWWFWYLWFRYRTYRHQKFSKTILKNYFLNEKFKKAHYFLNYFIRIKIKMKQ